METNIAIIIAVSDYHHENPLPACRSDGELVQAIIVRTGKFAPENTLAMVSGTTSSEVKAQLAAFIQSHKGKTIGEVFFYFTGHGDFDGSDFRFVLSDFQADRRHQTTLGNSELDDMLRSLSPSIGVKLVDACHSGVQYVKDPDSIDKALQGTKEGYKSCYFMFSSDRNQFSYQDGNLSYFTRSFANAIANHTGPAIRYKDVIDYISDDFQNSRQQKPVLR